MKQMLNTENVKNITKSKLTVKLEEINITDLREIIVNCCASLLVETILIQSFNKRVTLFYILFSVNFLCLSAYIFYWVIYCSML